MALVLRLPPSHRGFVCRLGVGQGDPDRVLDQPTGSLQRVVDQQQIVRVLEYPTETEIGKARKSDWDTCPSECEPSTCDGDW